MSVWLAARATRAWTRGIVLITLVGVTVTLSGCFGSIANPNATSNTVQAGSSGGTLDQQLLRAGIQQYDSHQYKNAIEDFDAAYALQGATSENRTQAAFDLGVLYAETDDYPDAESAFTRALNVDPTYSFALNDLAILESKTNKTLAISLYERLLKTHPANPAGVYTDLGNLYLQIGNKAKGNQDLSIASSLSEGGSPSTAVNGVTAPGGPTGNNQPVTTGNSQ